MIQAFLSKLGKRERLMAFVAGGFLFLMFMDRLVLGPILSEMKVLDKSIQAKTQLVKRNIRILSFRDSIVKEYHEKDRYLSAPDANQQEMIANDLHEIESLATQSTVTISNIKAGEITEISFAKELQVSLEFEGTLAHTVAFIKALEESVFLFRIKKFSMSPKSKTSELIKSSLEMTRTIIPKVEI